MKYKYFILLIILLSSPGVYAQKILKGIVTDVIGYKPLSGATITYGRKGTTTDADGKFSLVCGRTNALTVSLMQEVRVYLNCRLHQTRIRIRKFPWLKIAAGQMALVPERSMTIFPGLMVIACHLPGIIRLRSRLLWKPSVPVRRSFKETILSKMLYP